MHTVGRGSSSFCQARLRAQQAMAVAAVKSPTAFQGNISAHRSSEAVRPRQRGSDKVFHYRVNREATRTSLVNTAAVMSGVYAGERTIFPKTRNCPREAEECTSSWVSRCEKLQWLLGRSRDVLQAIRYRLRKYMGIRICTFVVK